MQIILVYRNAKISQGGEVQLITFPHYRKSQFAPVKQIHFRISNVLYMCFTLWILLQTIFPVPLLINKLNKISWHIFILHFYERHDFCTLTKISFYSLYPIKMVILEKYSRWFLDKIIWSSTREILHFYGQEVFA